MDEYKKSGRWVMCTTITMLVFFVVLIIIAPKFIMSQKGDDHSVICECSCPDKPVPGNNSIVADGYNVSIVLDGEKWAPPALLFEEEQGYVTLCRKEDLELVGHPNLSFTKTYKLWHQGYDELMYHSCFDDELAQVCWQSEAF